MARRAATACLRTIEPHFSPPGQRRSDILDAMYRTLSTSVAVAVFALTLAACGGGGVVPPRPLDIDASAADVYTGAIEAMANVTSYRWVADVEVDDGNGEIARVHVEGVWTADDSYDYRTSVDSREGLVESHVRVVEGRVFKEEGEIWREFVFQDPTGVPRFWGRSELLDLDEVAFSRKITSAGVYQLVGARTEEIEDLGSFRWEADLAIDHQDLRVVSSDATVTYENGGFYRQSTRFFRYNEPVSIDLPENRIDLPEPADPDATPTPRPTATPQS